MTKDRPCELCGIIFEAKSKGQSYYYYCDECKKAKPWMYARKLRYRCEELGINPNDWFRDHYRKY